MSSRTTVITTHGLPGPDLQDPSRCHLPHIPQLPSDQALEGDVTFLKVTTVILSPGICTGDHWATNLDGDTWGKWVYDTGSTWSQGNKDAHGADWAAGELGCGLD